MNPLEAWYFDIPIISRIYVSAAVLTSVAVQLGFVTPFRLYLSYQLVINRRQYWRLVTNFLYFGPLTLDFMLHMFFLVRYSRMLEEGSFYGRPADFLWLMIVSAILLLSIAYTTPLPFLAAPLAFTLVYIWARRNPQMRLNFLGLFNFSAPYLPWLLLGFAVMLNNVFPTADLMGIAVGHLYYFFEDVWPRRRESGGSEFSPHLEFATSMKKRRKQWQSPYSQRRERGEHDRRRDGWGRWRYSGGRYCRGE